MPTRLTSRLWEFLNTDRRIMPGEVPRGRRDVVVLLNRTPKHEAMLPQRPGASGVVELSPYDFMDRLVDLVPPPRKHRHRYHGLRSAVTSHDKRECRQAV